jgi:hypothetical protein
VEFRYFGVDGFYARTGAFIELLSFFMDAVPEPHFAAPLEFGRV